MSEEEDELNDLKEEFSQSEKLLSDLINEIAKLQIRTKYNEKNGNNYHKILQEKYDLEKAHKSNLKDIQDYKSQIIDLEKQLESQKSQISILNKENEELKSKITKTNTKIMPEPTKIRKLSDLRQSLGFHLKCFQNVDEKEEEKEDKKEEKEIYNTPGLNTDSKKIEFENLKKLKTEYEIEFHELQEKFNNFLKSINEQQIFFENYRSYINVINSQIGKFRQKLRISVVGHENLNMKKTSDIKVEQLIKDLDNISKKTFKANEISSIIKNKTLKKGENILHCIKTKLIGIDSNKNLTFNFLSNRVSQIEKEINNLKLLCRTLEENIKDTINKKNEIEETINIFKNNFESYIDNYKEDKKVIDGALDKSRRTLIRKKSKRFLEEVDKNIKNEKYGENENEDIYENIENKKEDIDLDISQASTLISINDFGKNINLFKSEILFENNINEIENEVKKLNKARLFQKNWNEICYVYDDYDIHDINYVLKAVGLGLYNYFNTSSVVFNLGRDIEILELEVNGEKAKYQYNNYSLDFNIRLNNLETAKIHLKYKEKPEIDTLSIQEIETRKLYRQEYYGLNGNLAGQMGKFRLILKGSFDIVSFQEEIFLGNEDSKNEKEYIWGGKIPQGGKKTLVKLSKNEAKWSFNFYTKIVCQNGNLEDTIIKVPMGFVGGNNEIIKMEYSSPQTKDIQVDEEQRYYEVKYNKTNFSTGEFILKGEIKNRCKGEWNIDLTDYMVERYMFSEDKSDKKQLEEIAKKIIEDFDKNNEDNIHNYMDYVKIGKWVNKNLQYDLNLSGRTELSALDIYYIKAGVCHHFTRLTNALLYSIGYKVLYINGFASRTGIEFDQNSTHSWSLIEINGKWFPFDATWGIFSGKLPVSHIFKGFYNSSVDLNGSDGVIFENNNEENGKFIE